MNCCWACVNDNVDMGDLLGEGDRPRCRGRSRCGTVPGGTSALYMTGSCWIFSIRPPPAALAGDAGRGDPAGHGPAGRLRRSGEREFRYAAYRTRVVSPARAFVRVCRSSRPHPTSSGSGRGRRVLGSEAPAARSISNNIETADIQRNWVKVTSTRKPTPRPVVSFGQALMEDDPIDGLDILSIEPHLIAQKLLDFQDEAGEITLSRDVLARTLADFDSISDEELMSSARYDRRRRCPHDHTRGQRRKHRPKRVSNRAVSVSRCRKKPVPRSAQPVSGQRSRIANSLRLRCSLFAQLL